MDYRSLLADIRNLGVTALTMGALGAELKLRMLGIDGDRDIRAALNGVVDTFEPGQFEGLSAAQLGSIVAQLTYNLQAALDMLREPERPAGWTYDDPAILQQIGRGSGAFAAVLAELAQHRPALAAVLEGDRTFLDIGTGVSWLAIESAKRWPSMRVVGLDIWEPALKLAEANIVAEGLQDRITLRRQNILDVDDNAVFDLVWLPTMFLPREVCECALPRIMRALRPGGMLVFGTFAAGGGPRARAVTDLLTVRSGGYPWRLEEAKERLSAFGLREIEIVEQAAGGASVVLGQRPLIS